MQLTKKDFKLQFALISSADLSSSMSLFFLSAKLKANVSKGS